ncbi:unnamed protein product [Ixodes persulcatus]
MFGPIRCPHVGYVIETTGILSSFPPHPHPASSVCLCTAVGEAERETCPYVDRRLWNPQTKHIQTVQHDNSGVYWPPQLSSTGKGPGQILQRIWTGRRHSPEEWVWFCGEFPLRPMIGQKNRFFLLEVCLRITHLLRILGSIHRLSAGKVYKRWIAKRIAILSCVQEFDDHRDADDAISDLNGKELLGER